MLPRQVILFLCLCFPLFSAPEYLVHVENVDQVAARSYLVLEQLDQHYFILADQPSLAPLAAFEQFSILDSDPRNKLYILVYGVEGRATLLAEYGTVLGYFDVCFLLSTTEENIVVIADLGFEIRRISGEPIQYTTDNQVYSPDYIRQTDTLIQKMVALVSEDTIRHFIRSLQAIETRFCSSTENKTIACPMVFNWLKAYGCDSVYSDTFNTSYGPNVIGIKKGKVDSSCTKYCLIGGHVDGQPSTGRAPAADDNGTGVALFLEVARVLQKYTFENTIQFHGWNAEEVGDVGSKAFAKYAKDGGHTILGGTLVFDMIGCTLHGKNVDIFYNDASSDFALNVVKKAADTYTNLNYAMQNSTSIPTDQASFWNQGFAAVACVENYYIQNETYHTSNDTLDNPLGLNDTKHVTEVVKAACAIVATLAKPMNISPVSHIISGTNTRTLFRCVPVSESKLAITFVYPCITGSVRVRLYSAQGQLLRATVIPINANSGISYLWEFPDQPLQAGFYIVRVGAGARTYTQKIAVLF